MFLLIASILSLILWGACLGYDIAVHASLSVIAVDLIFLCISTLNSVMAYCYK
jgi:hypothetical protein